jgi:hypothetical protein
MISKTMLDRLGWEIEAPTSQTIVIGDRYVATPLGKIYDLPVQFG